MDHDDDGYAGPNMSWREHEPPIEIHEAILSHLQ